MAMIEVSGVRAWAERSLAFHGPDSVTVAAGVLALVEVAEALEDYDGPLAHTWRCEYRTAAKGWKPGDPPVIECVCGLARLEAALAKFEGVARG